MFWLIYNEQDTRNNSQSDVLLELNQTNLHVDSEISYIDFRHSEINETGVRVPLFDVYNNGHHAGGLLRVSHDRDFRYALRPPDDDNDHQLGTSLAEQTPKYVRRMDLSDLVLRVGTVYQIIDNRVLTTESIIDHLMSENNTQFDVLNRPTFQMGMHVQELLQYK